ncbi:MAG: Phosphoglycerol transferase, alkaline phosphatase superfamily [Herbinix sp.]|jgi:phosphoglycerol transferase MdoB-like AlkP superfamily enzyme|nr:Phosphoglycerol transferase, alkaline phosphatase superfamily [Herbinix sp.]
MENRKAEIRLQLISKKSIASYILSIYFVFVLIVSIQQEVLTPSKVYLITGLFFLWFVLTLVSVMDVSVVSIFLKKHQRWMNGLILVIAPVISFIMTELMVSNLKLELIKDYGRYNVIWYYLLYFLLYCVIRSSRVAIIAGNLLVYFAAALNYLIMLFRGNPIIPSDLLAWRTGVSVASGYELYFSKDFILATVIMYALYTVGQRLEAADKRPSIINRGVVLVVFSIIAAIPLHAFFATDLIKSKIQVIDFFAPKYTYAAFGTAFGFVANLEAMQTEPPEGYSVEKVEEIMQDVPASDEEELYPVIDKYGLKPNIIVIMNEAFSDLSLLGNFPTNKEYLPYIRSMNNNTTKGTMYVSVFGGATSDTEYEFLTGNSMAVMPANSVPYQQFVTEPSASLAATLKERGYYNIAIHPYEPSGYKRDLVYPLLGFDEFLSKDDFDHPSYIRSFISDHSSFQKVIEQYEAKKEDGPLFIFNVTMQNHGGYSSEQIFKEEDTVRLIGYDNYPVVEQYLSLVRATDEAFGELIEYFKQQKEPTIVLMFGDHQPVAYAELYNSVIRPEQEKDLKYRVPFIMWANYAIGEDDVDKISANYLSSYLLRTAGIPGTDYNNYLWKLHEEIPVINGLYYMDKTGVTHSFTERISYMDLINDYKIVGYNNALDKNDQIRNYFFP